MSLLGREGRSLWHVVLARIASHPVSRRFEAAKPYGLCPLLGGVKRIMTTGVRLAHAVTLCKGYIHGASERPLLRHLDRNKRPSRALGDDACRQKRNARWRQGSYTATFIGWYVYTFCITYQSGTYRLLLQVTAYGGGFLSAP